MTILLACARCGLRCERQAPTKERCPHCGASLTSIDEMVGPRTSAPTVLWDLSEFDKRQLHSAHISQE